MLYARDSYYPVEKLNFARNFWSQLPGESPNNHKSSVMGAIQSFFWLVEEIIPQTISERLSFESCIVSLGLNLLPGFCHTHTLPSFFSRTLISPDRIRPHCSSVHSLWRHSTLFCRFFVFSSKFLVAALHDYPRLLSSLLIANNSVGRQIVEENLERLKAHKWVLLQPPHKTSLSYLSQISHSWSWASFQARN